MATRKVNRDPLALAITKRRENTSSRLDRFGDQLRKILGPDEKVVLGDHTCIYAVGSGGRGELAPQSDLDLFVVRVGKESSLLDAAIIQAAIIKASRRERFPDPSGDGEWLKLHSAERFVGLLGSPADDTENTFTARLLLLLESRPVLGQAAYDQIVDHMLSAYWTNASAHPTDYQPILLLNDIVRYWRILLLNCEAHNIELQKKIPPDQLGGKRRLKSYKLRFSRCLTCYSGVAYLLALTADMKVAHVEKEDARHMVSLSPLERLLWVRKRAKWIREVPELVDFLIERYLAFLDIAARGKAELEMGFGRKEFRRERSKEKDEFGEAMFGLISILGKESALYRWIVV